LETRSLIHAILANRDNLPARKLNCGEVLLYQGEPANYVSVIASGVIFAQTFTKDGNSIWLEEFGADQFIGIESVFTGTPLSYELIAKSDVTIIRIKRMDFLSLIKSHDGGLELILKEMSSRLLRNTERLIEANSLSARGRICAELKRHSNPIGIEPGKHIIRPTPVFSEFALRAGSTRESVSRTVSDLAKAGVIVRETGALVISNMKALEARIR